jgi:hypothetical protein
MINPEAFMSDKAISARKLRLEAQSELQEALLEIQELDGVSNPDTVRAAIEIAKMSISQTKRLESGKDEAVVGTEKNEAQTSPGKLKPQLT